MIQQAAKYDSRRGAASEVDSTRTTRASSASREVETDHLSPRDYDKISELIGRVAGIRLPPAKRMMVEGRLRKRLRALGISTLGGYSRYLFEQGGLEKELPDLIDVITTNKTDFFREPEHFKLLEQRLVPSLLRQARSPGKPLLKIWSAASSTGAEAYTIAMVLAELAEQRRDFRFGVLGTDICNSVLEQAERAVYPGDMAAPVPLALQDRYLMRARRANRKDEVRVAPELRRHVRFARLNLMEQKYPVDREVDVIFLRNVLIYFDRADQATVINRLVGHLRPGGFLLLGLSESMVGDMGAVRQLAPAVFEKL